MERKTINIDIPNNLEIDWEESKKQNKIVLKDKQLTYKDVCTALYKDKRVYYTTADGDIVNMPSSEMTSQMTEDTLCDPNNASIKHQLEYILARNKLANVAKHLNGGWNPKSGDIVCEFVLEGRNRNIVFPLFSWDVDYCYFPQFVFKDTEMAERAIEILGEETIKLALEPLGV